MNERLQPFPKVVRITAHIIMIRDKFMPSAGESKDGPSSRYVNHFANGEGFKSLNLARSQYQALLRTTVPYWQNVLSGKNPPST